PRTPPHPRPPLFPYTTLFRSAGLELRLGPAFGNLRLRDPQQGVQNDPPEVVVPPVPVEVAAGEPEAAAAVRALDAPHHVLDLTADRKSTRLNSSHVKISYAVF